MVAVYLGDLWHSKDRLTAAGDTTAPCSWAREAQDLWAGAGFGGKNGWRIYTRLHIGKIQRNIEKSTQGCEKQLLKWGKPHAGVIMSWYGWK